MIFQCTALIYCYQASDLKAYKICKILLPYLIIKKENAKRIIMLRKSKNTIKPEQRGSNQGRRMAQEVLDYREKLYQLCKKGGDLEGGQVKTLYKQK